MDAIQDGKVVAKLVPHLGSATADRTAGQMRSAEVEIFDVNLTPQDMTSLLAPGTRLQLRRGVRLSNVDTRVQVANSAASWAVSTPTGMFNSVMVDGTGALTLGP